MWKKIKSFLLENKTASQTVAKNTLWLGISNIGGRILRAGIIIYAARVLGADAWGAFSYAITLAAFLTIFADFGVNHIVNRDASKNISKEEKDSFLSTAFLLKILFFVPSALFVLFGAPLFSKIKEAIPLFPMIALIIAGDTFREFGSAINKAMERMEREAASYLITNIAIIIFGFTFLAYSATAKSLAFGYAAGTTTGTLATFWMLRHILPSLRKGFSGKIAKAILSSAWPFAISGFLGILMLNTDILLLGIFRDASEVGFYSAPQRIIQLLYMIPAIIAAGILPSLARLAYEDVPKLQKIVERILGVSYAIAIPIAVGGILLSSEIISFVFGDAYLAGVVAFQILMLTLIVDFPSVILSNVVFAHNRQKYLIIYGIIGGFSNVILDLIFIPSFGMVGSAWATFIAQVVGVSYLWYVTKNIIPLRPIHQLYNVMVATIFMAFSVGILKLLSVHVALIIICSVVIYLAFLIFKREPLLLEIKLILSEKK